MKAKAKASTDHRWRSRICVFSSLQSELLVTPLQMCVLSLSPHP